MVDMASALYVDPTFWNMRWMTWSVSMKSRASLSCRRGPNTLFSRCHGGPILISQLYRRTLELKAKHERGSSYLDQQELSSRRFQHFMSST